MENSLQRLLTETGKAPKRLGHCTNLRRLELAGFEQVTHLSVDEGSYKILKKDDLKVLYSLTEQRTVKYWGATSWVGGRPRC